MGDKPTFMLTAAGILVAILLVWAQLLTTTAIERKHNCENAFTVGFELAWVYWAILFALVSFISTFIAYFLNKSVLNFLLSSIALLFFISSIILALLLVFFSVLPVSIKVLMNYKLLSPLDKNLSKRSMLNKISQSRDWRLIIVFIIPLATPIILLGIGLLCGICFFFGQILNR
ncbi:MAG: hypothetical protein ABIB93_08315 [Chloroflexota bacterium]